MPKKSRKTNDNEILWKVGTLILAITFIGTLYFSIQSTEDISGTSVEYNKLKTKYSNLLNELAMKEVLIDELTRKDCSTAPLQIKPKHQTFLFIGILSSPTNYERRQAVRSTWVNFIGDQQVVWKFFIGANLDKKNVEDKIVKEENQFNDIIRVPYTVEVYEKLIEKTLNVMKWVNENYEVSYFMKTDDDSFIRPDLIVPELIARNNPALTYMGFIHQ
jgi:hypothetical protein